MPNRVVLYDACVLYPAGLRSILMYIGISGLVQVKWSEAIHDEWIRNVLKDRNDLTQDQLYRTRQLMNTAIPDATVLGYEKLIDDIHLPDINDNHVLAAAIHAKADTIVTFNTKDFPEAIISRYGIRIETPDLFIFSLLRSHPNQVVAAIKIDRLSKKRPPKSPDEYLKALDKHCLTLTANELQKYIDKI